MPDLAVLTVIGAIMGAASFPIARFPKLRMWWGAAWADPTSIPWMMGFLLYGPVVAFCGSAVGAVMIWKASPERAPALGALHKFLGTGCVWVTVTALVFLFWGGQFPPPQLATAQMAAAVALLSGLVRTVVTLPLDYSFSMPYYRSRYIGRTVTRAEVLADFGGGPRLVVVLTIFNLWLSLFDLLVPWVFLYPTGLTKVLVL